MLKGWMVVILLTWVWGQSLSEREQLSASLERRRENTPLTLSEIDGLHETWSPSHAGLLRGWHILQPNWLRHQTLLQFRRRIGVYSLERIRNNPFHNIPWEKQSPPPEENWGVAHYLYLREAARCILSLCHNSSLEAHISPFWHPSTIPHTPASGEIVEAAWHPWAGTFIETHALFFHSQNSAQLSTASSLPSTHVRITAMQVLGKHHSLRIAAEAEAEYAPPSKEHLPALVHLSSAYTMLRTRAGKEIALSLEIHNLLNARVWAPFMNPSIFPSLGREFRIGLQGNW